MEVAKLFDQDVSIAQEWFDQASTGTSRESIIRTLENKYRIHSNKKAFECKGCQQPVSLVLRADSPHFRHQGDPCPSAQNYHKYINRINTGEDNLTHRAGRAILRTYLEGQLKPHAVLVQDGYMCRFTLKIVPDFILTFPDGSMWAIDYVTGSREDESYNSYILKRTETYRAAGFKPFYFIDSSWLADVPDRSIVSLYLAESQMRVQSTIDLQWTAFVQEFVEAFGKPFVLSKWFGFQRETFGNEHNPRELIDVYSLAYVDPGDGKAFIQRFIPAQRKFGYHVHRSTISLEKATSLAESRKEFQWWDLDESENMRARLEALTMQYDAELSELAEQERKQQEILQAKREEKANLKPVSHTYTDEIPAPAGNELNSTFLDQDAESLAALIKVDMTVFEAIQILHVLRAKKTRLSKSTLDRIHVRALQVMGPIRKPNPIPSDLRRALIDLAAL